MTLEFTGWRLCEPSMLSCWVSALATCLARYPLSPVPCSSSALPAALSTCGHCPPALCRIVPSCELWEVAEDALLNLTVLFIFQSQKDLNSKIRVIRRGRKTTESLSKKGISSYPCYQSTGGLRLSLFKRRGCRLSSSWKECEWPVDSKDFLCAPQGTSKASGRFHIECSFCLPYSAAEKQSSSMGYIQVQSQALR